MIRRYLCSPWGGHLFDAVLCFPVYLIFPISPLEDTTGRKNSMSFQSPLVMQCCLELKMHTWDFNLVNTDETSGARGVTCWAELPVNVGSALSFPWLSSKQDIQHCAIGIRQPGGPPAAAHPNCTAAAPTTSAARCAQVGSEVPQPPLLLFAAPGLLAVMHKVFM